MSSYKFGQVTVSSKQFYGSIDTDIKTLNVDNIVVSDPIIDNKKGKRYIVGYNIDGKIIPLRIKTSKSVFSYGVQKNSETSKLCMCFNLEGYDEWIDKYEKIWKAVEEQIFQCLTANVVKKGKYINSKLNMYGDKIAVSYHGKEVPYAMYCKVTAILRIGNVYNQGGNY